MIHELFQKYVQIAFLTRCPAFANSLLPCRAMVAFPYEQLLWTIFRSWEVCKLLKLMFPLFPRGYDIKFQDPWYRKKGPWKSIHNDCFCPWASFRAWWTDTACVASKVHWMRYYIITVSCMNTLPRCSEFCHIGLCATTIVFYRI